MHLISDTAELSAACDRLAAHPFVTVDTEFLRETTYYPKLCLIQLASPEEAVLVDPLAPDLDLAPFFGLMVNDAVVKVFHAARQDLEIVWLLGRVLPVPLFDTQVAAMVCGYGDLVGYEQLANDLAKARIDKSSRFTDWSRRPLTEAQFSYAELDVTHLRDIYLALQADLDASGRESWVAEEMAVLSSPGTYEVKPENAWLRLKGRVRKPRELPVLMELAAWREREAQTRDVPRQRVLKDDALMDIVQRGAAHHGRAGGIALGPQRLRALAQRRRGPCRDRTRRGHRSEDPASAGARARPADQRCRARPAQGAAQGGCRCRARRAEDHRHQRRPGGHRVRRAFGRARAQGLATGGLRREGAGTQERLAQPARPARACRGELKDFGPT